MCTYIVILLFVCNTLAYYEFDENSLNVGTVLFNSSDVNKNKWTHEEIGLLRARRYFQKVIPPPHFLRTADENFVDKLLTYFKDTYSSIKRDANDRESDKIMTTALSDTIGGYLKEWVLPITKYAFYGGTVSQGNVMKIFNFYDDIKSYLGTDGHGWREPNQNLITSSTVKVAPTKQFTEREMKNPCEKLAYFEQTASGLSVPMPYVNWNSESSTMFVPLKNLSLIPLKTPSSVVNPLTVYYDLAKRCTETINQDEENHFDDKFHVWLCNDVLPHLNDDHVYLGLGNVLSLNDNFKEPCQQLNIVDVIKQPLCRFKRISKKMMIVITLLIIEAAWCIPALVLLLRNKMKKNVTNCMSSKGNNTTQSCATSCKYTNTTKPKTYNQTSDTESLIDSISKWTNTSERNSFQADHHKYGIKLSNKNQPQVHNVALETNVSMFMAKHSIGTGSEIHYSSKLCSTSFFNIINESPIPKLKPNSKLSSSSNYENKNLSQNKCPCPKPEPYGAKPDRERFCSLRSIDSIQEKNKLRNIKAIKERKKVKQVMKEVCKRICETKMIEDTKKEPKCECLPCAKFGSKTEQLPVSKHLELQRKQTSTLLRKSDSTTDEDSVSKYIEPEQKHSSILCTKSNSKTDQDPVSKYIEPQQKRTSTLLTKSDSKTEQGSDSKHIEPQNKQTCTPCMKSDSKTEQDYISKHIEPQKKHTSTLCTKSDSKAEQVSVSKHAEPQRKQTCKPCTKFDSKTEEVSLSKHVEPQRKQTFKPCTKFDLIKTEEVSLSKHVEPKKKQICTPRTKSDSKTEEVSVSKHAEPKKKQTCTPCSKSDSKTEEVSVSKHAEPKKKQTCTPCTKSNLKTEEVSVSKHVEPKKKQTCTPRRKFDSKTEEVSVSKHVEPKKKQTCTPCTKSYLKTEEVSVSKHVEPKKKQTCTPRTKSDSKTEEVSVSKHVEPKKKQTCTPCTKSDLKTEEVSVSKHVEPKKKQTCTPRTKSDSKTERVFYSNHIEPERKHTGTTNKRVETKLCFQNETYSKDGKLKADKPYVEVTIDLPHKDIIIAHSKNIQNVEFPQPVRPSRIPKPAPICPNSVRKPPTPRKAPNVASANYHKSHIPLLTRRAADDLAIKTNKKSKNDKLNVTL